MTLSEMVAALWRRRIVLLATVLVALFIGTILGLTAGSSDSARSQVLLVQPQTAAAGDLGLVTQQKLNLQALTYSRVVTARQFLDDALGAAGLSRRDETVTATVDANTPLLTLTVRAASAKRAQSVLDAVDQHLRTIVEEANSGAPADNRASVQVVQPPLGSQGGQNIAFTMLVAVVVGAVVAVTGILVVEST